MCQEQWVGQTATGVKPRVNRTIAVDPRVIPLGSTVWINGQEYKAEDTGGAIKGNHIDIFVETDDDDPNCNRYGTNYYEVYLKED